MEVVIGSRHLAADLAVALDVAGREHLVIVAKATWRIPEAGQRPVPLPPQPLVHADEYYGDPGLSAMRYGADFARFKPRCDLLFDACAHPPDGAPVSELIVAWRVGATQKALRVHGPRTWVKRRGGYAASPALPFSKQPLHYGLAFGGSRAYMENGQAGTEALLANPAGIGWAGRYTAPYLEGLPAPSLEAIDNAVSSPTGKHAPIAFSAVGRHWHPRASFAGTYDEHWKNEIFPFLPPDFDERFHLCAPEDQQIDYPQGGEPVILRHMLENRPDVRFSLPAFDTLKIRVLRTDYTQESPSPVVDTLFFEPEAGRFSAVWRASLPIRRRIQEFDTIAIGPVDPKWWDAKRLGTSGCVNCNDDDAVQEATA